jgi:hypothetical protein
MMLTLAARMTMTQFSVIYWGFIAICLLCAVFIGIRAIVRRLRGSKRG